MAKLLKSRVRVRVRIGRVRVRALYIREREREPERGFSSWNILVICRRTVQIECDREREQISVRANGRLDYPQREFSQKVARLFCCQPISSYLACIISTNRNLYA